MPFPYDRVVDMQLKKEMCPGGAGHNGTEYFKAQCPLCRATAQADARAAVAANPDPSGTQAEPVATGTTRPGPGDRRRR